MGGRSSGRDPTDIEPRAQGRIVVPTAWLAEFLGIDAGHAAEPDHEAPRSHRAEVVDVTNATPTLF